MAGDAPLYGGLDTIKHADALRARPSAGRRGCGARTGAGSRWAARRTATRRSRWRSGHPARRSSSPGPCTGRCCSAWCWPGCARCGSGRTWTRRRGCPRRSRSQTVRAALAAHPDACAVFLGDPSYVGTTGDLTGHAEVAHEAGVPLIVDTAWAAHLGFHPDLPPHAIAAGADAMVTSAHKALPAYTQGALVLARTERLDPARLDRAFEATHTTSPTGRSWPASTPPGRCWPGDGERLCGRLLAGGRRPAAAAPGPGARGARRAGRGAGQADRAAGRHRRERERGRGRPDRRRDAGGDGGPGHARADRHPRRRRGAARGVRRHARRGIERTAARRGTRRRRGLDGRAADGAGTARGVLRPRTRPCRPTPRSAGSAPS